MRSGIILYVSSAALLISGVAATFLTHYPWAQPAGSVIAAIGGALLTFALTGDREKERENAKALLQPDLQSAARHLADTIAKLSRIGRDYDNELLDAELAVDRVQQLNTTFYASLHDLNVLAGSTTNFEKLVETVKVCEDTAEEFTRVMAQQPDGAKEEKIESLLMRFEAARQQLTHTAGGYLPPEGKKKLETVACPACGTTREAEVSLKPGPGVTLHCETCGETYHAFRQQAGHVRIVPWGGGESQPHRVIAECPHCGSQVPANLKDEEDACDRFCLACCEFLRIDRDGNVYNHTSSKPLVATLASIKGKLPFLSCPKCGITVRSLWQGDGLARGVCLRCQQVLQIPFGQHVDREQETGQASSETAPIASPDDPQA